MLFVENSVLSVSSVATKDLIANKIYQGNPATQKKDRLMKVSIITVTYNSADTLQSCIDSVASQSCVKT